MPLIYILNNSGSNIDPRGTPYFALFVTIRIYWKLVKILVIKDQ